ncbi:MAG: flagellar basal body L-ring protein FlgH [Deltaproteobacteria bacterium]|jgi:flagellar L-ring protein precursor FlgH|nr:flagellar basal body L-ring protein FlgH [Deltaproteobacteria bacterium]
MDRTPDRRIPWPHPAPLPAAELALAALLAALAATGCGPKLQTPSSLSNQEAALMNPPVQTYAPPAIMTEGSLFSEDTRPDFFADLKAQRVGDIITVNIVESSRASKQAATALNRNGSVNATTSTLFGLGFDEMTDEEKAKPGFNLKRGIDASMSTQFTGNGQTSRNETITAKVSARIIQVLPNSNLVVRGSQEILVNNEKQYITVQGVVRPEDIATDNTVLSTYLADARIEYTGKGDITNKQREGWLTRLVNVIWPF